MRFLTAVLVLASMEEVSPCAATSTTTTPSTTPATSCSTCTANSIDFILTGEGATDFSPPMGTLSMDAAGCNQLLLECLPGADGASTIDNGADSNTVTYCNNFGTCIEMLTCNAMGQWTLTQSGMTVVITEIRCAAT